MAYQLPALPYAYDALEPHFDAQTMEIHHSKHHQAYVNNANAVLANLPEWEKLSAEELIARLAELPENVRTPLRNNAGGHANHSLFWQILKTGTTLQGKLKAAIERDFGSVVAGLDLNRLSERNIQILDNQTIIINLPPVEILAVQLDNIDVYDIRTGALNLYQADLNVLGEVQYHAKRQILRQACADQILQRAAERSKSQIEQLFALTPLKVSVYTPAALPECKLAARAQASQAQR